MDTQSYKGKAVPAQGLQWFTTIMGWLTLAIYITAGAIFVPLSGNKNNEYAVRSTHTDLRATTRAEVRRENMFHEQEVLEWGFFGPYSAFGVVYLLFLIGITTPRVFRSAVFANLVAALSRAMVMFFLVFLLCLVSEIAEIGTIIALSIIAAYSDLALTMYIGEEEEKQLKNTWREAISMLVFFFADLSPYAIMLVDTLSILPKASTDHERTAIIATVAFLRFMWWTIPLGKSLTCNDQCMSSCMTTRGYRRPERIEGRGGAGANVVCNQQSCKMLTFFAAFVVLGVGAAAMHYVGLGDYPSHAIFYRYTNAPGAETHYYPHVSVDAPVFLIVFMIMGLVALTHYTLKNADNAELLCILEGATAAVWILIVAATGVIGEIGELISYMVLAFITGLDIHVFSSDGLAKEKHLEWFYVILAFVTSAILPFAWVFAKAACHPQLREEGYHIVGSILLMLALYRIIVYAYTHFFVYKLSPSAKNAMGLLLSVSPALQLGALVTLLVGIVDDHLYYRPA